MQVSIKRIQIREGRRSLDMGHVKELTDSIRELGLLNPLTIDRENFLIAGLHRLEAVKALGWTDVECTVSSLEGLAAELAEIDENFIRNDLSPVEYGEMLLRRKEIYETLHPETKRGGDRKSEEIKRTKCPFDPAKSFVDDTADKLGVNPRTVRRQIQTAKNLTPETKEIIKGTDTKISKKAAMKLSNLKPEQQKEAAALLAAKEIRTVDEYTRKRETTPDDGNERLKAPETGAAGQPETENRTEKAAGSVASAPLSQPVSQKAPAASLKDVVAELKDPDKDCSGTPDSFLEEYEAFVRKFHKEIGWYSDPYYDAVFPFVSPEQLSHLRQLTDSICSAAGQLFNEEERTMMT